MIETHFHCLPGIDDGPRDWDEALALCRMAGDDGVSTIVATPHVLRDAWANDNPSVIELLVAELNDRLGGFPKVLPGCEFMFASDAVPLCEKVDGESPLIRLNNANYLLCEFPSASVPAYVEGVFHELSLLGITPIIAHPERNLIFSRDPERLLRLVRGGAICQVTAASVIGEFGKAASSSATRLIDQGLIHIIASDAHSIGRRPPRMSLARKQVEKRWGRDAARAMCEVNPAAVIAGQRLNRGGP